MSQTIAIKIAQTTILQIGLQAESQVQSRAMPRWSCGKPQYSHSDSRPPIEWCFWRVDTWKKSVLQRQEIRIKRMIRLWNKFWITVDIIRVVAGDDDGLGRCEACMSSCLWRTPIIILHISGSNMKGITNHHPIVILFSNPAFVVW